MYEGKTHFDWLDVIMDADIQRVLTGLSKSPHLIFWFKAWTTIIPTLFPTHHLL